MHVNTAITELFLNRIAAIRAAAEILDGNHDLTMDDKQVFLGVIHSETLQLERLVYSMRL